MQNLRACYKLTLFFIYVMAYFTQAFFVSILNREKRYIKRAKLSKIIQKYASKTIRLLNVDVIFKGEEVELENLEKTLVVSNHLSYLDVIAMAAYFPACFVTSVEMKNTFFLGQICEAGGCLYVERRNKKNIINEIQDITNALEAKLNVIIYPEATSTNGEEVLRFKRPLFRAAIDSGAKILPVTLNYKWISFEKLDRTNRDTVCWYGDMEFFPHFWNLLKEESIQLEVNLAKSYIVNEEDSPADLALMSHGVVNSYYRPISIA